MSHGFEVTLQSDSIREGTKIAVLFGFQKELWGCTEDGTTDGTDDGRLLFGGVLNREDGLVNETSRK